MPVPSRMSTLVHAKAVLDVVSTLAVVVVAIVLTWTLVRDRTSAPGVTRSGSGNAQVEDVNGLGIAAAKITNVQGQGLAVIVEFSDFQCPFCGRHARDTFPAIKDDIVETGQARYIAFHFPLDGIHPHALKAAEAAECAGRQGRFGRCTNSSLPTPALSGATNLFGMLRTSASMRRGSKCVFPGRLSKRSGPTRLRDGDSGSRVLHRFFWVRFATMAVSISSSG